MAGHSQFKNIMHRKGRQDAIRSKLFGKLAREITVAAKLGSKTTSAQAAQSRPTRMAMLQCVTEPPEVIGRCWAAREPVCTSRAGRIVGVCPFRAVIPSPVSRRVRDGFAAICCGHGYSSVVPLLLLWACASSPDGHPDGEPDGGSSFSVSISQGELVPAFDPDILHYTVAGSALIEKTTTITTSDEDAILEQRTMDGDVLAGDAGSIDVALTEREYVQVSDGERVYQITVVPSDLGIASAEGVASEGYFLLTPSPFPLTLVQFPFTGFRSRSWKSKLKSTSGDAGSIFTLAMLPSGSRVNVTYASARTSRSVQRATNVSYCQCSSLPTSTGEWVNRIISWPLSSVIATSPYHGSR